MAGLLLHSVNRQAAVLMVVFAVAGIPLSFFAVVKKLDALSLLSGAEYLGAFPVDQLHAQVMLALRSASNAGRVAEIFWGLWLFPFGYLVFRSGFLPRVLGVLLMAGCFGYLTVAFGPMLVPGALGTKALYLIPLPAHVGEIGTCLWLLIVGVRPPARITRSTPST
jgi:hypothetical protein